MMAEGRGKFVGSLSVRPRIAFLAYMVIDLVCVGMGMGLPLFCIALGFLVGW